MLICDQKWREAMTGSLSLYDKHGERLHTIYVGAAPEYGKETFFNRMEREIVRVKTLYSTAHFVGIADGARSNWDSARMRRAPETSAKPDFLENLKTW